MQVSECMSRDVTIATPEMTIQDVATQMRVGDFGVLPVGENGELVGMVTDRDIVIRAIADGRDPKTTVVRSVMSENVASCFEDQDVNEVMETMGEKQIRRMPVLNRENKLVGILAIGDLAQDGRETNSAAQALNQISQPSGTPLHS